jgi:hypothetical protein
MRLSMCESYGEQPVVCYLPSETEHGNFLPETYRAIRQHQNWSKRLEKVHTQGRSGLPKNGYRWRELDSCNSSDALLMNVFCFPGTLKQPTIFNLLGVEPGVRPEFGVKARVPLMNGRADRTEVDMLLGDLLVEAKLTESDFQSEKLAVLHNYRDFVTVFDIRSLPRDGEHCISYQLVRNVLAAYASRCSFCVMLDARRPDLREAWYAVMQAVKPVELRVRCKMITWQELAPVLPRKLQAFLAEKYGICHHGSDLSPAIAAD